MVVSPSRAAWLNVPYFTNVRLIKYKKHWSYLGPATKAEGSLAEFVLDVLYLMENGIIPPVHVLNEVLRSGGNNGGMGPGTTWRKFEIDDAEYEELVSALLSFDVSKAKKKHPYLYANHIVRDEELENCVDYLSWLRAVSEKHKLPT